MPDVPYLSKKEEEKAKVEWRVASLKGVWSEGGVGVKYIDKYLGWGLG